MLLITRLLTLPLHFFGNNLVCASDSGQLRWELRDKMETADLRIPTTCLRIRRGTHLLDRVSERVCVCVWARAVGFLRGSVADDNDRFSAQSIGHGRSQFKVHTQRMDAVFWNCFTRCSTSWYWGDATNGYDQSLLQKRFLAHEKSITSAFECPNKLVCAEQRV